MIKSIVKTLVGTVRTICFRVQAGKNVYIGKHCSFKGERNIVLEDEVTVRPYAQIWSGGDGENRQRLRNW